MALPYQCKWISWRWQHIQHFQQKQPWQARHVFLCFFRLPTHTFGVKDTWACKPQMCNLDLKACGQPLPRLAFLLGDWPSWDWPSCEALRFPRRAADQLLHGGAIIMPRIKSWSIASQMTDTMAGSAKSKPSSMSNGKLTMPSLRASSVMRAVPANKSKNIFLFPPRVSSWILALRSAGVFGGFDTMLDLPFLIFLDVLTFAFRGPWWPFLPGPSLFTA